MRVEGKPEQASNDQTGKSFNVRRRAIWDQIEPLLSINQNACASGTLIRFHGIKVFTVLC